MALSDFVKSQDVVRIINQSKTYNEKPGDILNIEDEYLAFCFNEACMYIRDKLEEVDEKGKPANKPRWLESKEKQRNQKNNSELIEWISSM